MQRRPTLEAAIEVCKQHKVEFWFEWNGKQHIKFYVNGSNRYVLLSQGNKGGKSENIAKSVRKDVERLIEGMRK